MNIRKQIFPLWVALLAAILVAALLEPIKTSNQHSYASSLSTHADLADNWDSIGSAAKATFESLREVSRQAIDGIGRLASNARQAFDRPITDVTEKILSSRQVMDIIGIKTHGYISDVTGIVNMYIVDDNGLLAGIMDRTIGLVGFAKAGGVALYPVGIFMPSASIGTTVAYHEYCHYFQQSVFGFAEWLAMYSGEIMVKTAIDEDICVSYADCTWEKAANAWAATA